MLSQMSSAGCFQSCIPTEIMAVWFRDTVPTCHTKLWPDSNKSHSSQEVIRELVFLFNLEEVKNQTRSFTSGHCLGFAPPCSFLCFLLRASPALCALIGPSPPHSLAYLAFLQGLGSAGAFHSHQSRLFPLEKAKFFVLHNKMQCS